MKTGYIFYVATYSLLVFVTLGISCKSAKDGGTASQQKVTAGVYQSLLDYLRRDPSVKIEGNGEDARVFVRGKDTINGNSEPLFVIDGSMVGESYTQASRMVDVNDIKSVTVLKLVDATAQYGLRGNKGAVVIRTKMGR